MRKPKSVVRRPLDRSLGRNHRSDHRPDPSEDGPKGQSPNRSSGPRGEAVLGIDLGTTNTVCAVGLEGKVRVLSPGGERIIPSVLAIDSQGKIAVGHAAEKIRAKHPESAVFSAKRLLGRRFDAPQVSRMITSMPYRIVKGRKDSVAVKLEGRCLAVEEVSAQLLSYAKQSAEQSIGQRIRYAVIAVPANFSKAQRHATKRAAQMAGLETLRIINEPTAAALAYRDFSAHSQRIAVYDFGGGTFDMSILELSPGCARVLSTAGDMFLGGDDMDQEIIASICNEYRRKFGFELPNSTRNLSILRRAAQALKMALGNKKRAKMQLGAMCPEQSESFEYILSRETFDHMIAPIIRRTLTVCEEALRVAGLNAKSLDQVVLVGGPTQIPSVRNVVSEFFGKSPDIKANPLTAVAIGAAMQGAALLRAKLGASSSPQMFSTRQSAQAGSTETQDQLHAHSPEPSLPEAELNPLLVDVAPKSLGVRTVGGQVDMLIERNATIPLEQTRKFTTTYDAQHKVKIEICEGESLQFDNNLKLGEVQLQDLPYAKRGQLCIAVTFVIDSDGLLTVRAHEVDSGKKTQTSLQVFGLAA